MPEIKLNQKKRLLFGVCFKLSEKFNQPVKTIRIIFLVALAIMLISPFVGFAIPLPVLPIYLILALVFADWSKISKGNVKFKIILTILGLLIGLPMSYYFQTDFLQNVTGSITGYFEYLLNSKNSNISETHAKNILSNIITSVLAFGIVGFLIGLILDRTKNINK